MSLKGNHMSNEIFCLQFFTTGKFERANVKWSKMFDTLMMKQRPV